MTEYAENFIETYTGKKFHYLNPIEDEIDIVDIAHSLSLSCRFKGHTKCFYSVAEHSVRVAEIVPDSVKPLALLHDAAEAYIPDIPSPMKEHFGLKVVEEKILECIYKKYKICYTTQDLQIVKHADNTLLATEARDLMTNMNGWATLPPPLDNTIYPLSPESSEKLFLAKFQIYQRRF